MGLFNKNALSELMVIKFSKKDTELFKKNTVMQQLIQEIGHDNRTEINAINSALPLMKLSVANTLFKLIQERIGKQGQYVAFETIEILYREDKGKSFKYIPYLQVKDFGIDIKYKDFTGFVFENIFNGEEFEDIDIETKRDWARQFLDEYVKANPKQKVLALLPTETEAANGYIPQYQGIDDVIKTVEQNKKVVQNSSKPSEKKENSKNSTKEGTAEKNKKSLQDVNALARKHDVGIDKKIELPIDKHRGKIKVPKFETKDLKQVTVTDKNYVPYKVNEKKVATNKYLSTFENQINLKNSEFLTTLSQELLEDVENQVEQFRKENNPEKGLHNEIKNKLLAAKSVEEKSVIERMQAKCDEDVLAIRRKADNDIAERKSKLEADIALRKDEISESYAKKATEEEQKELIKRNDELNQKIDKLKKSLTLKAVASYNAKADEVVANAHKLAGTVYKKLANTIETWEQGVNKEHLNAVEVQASADRAKFNLEDVSVLNEKNRQLKAEKYDSDRKVESLRKENSKLVDRVNSLQEQILNAKNSSSEEDFFKEYLKTQLLNQKQKKDEETASIKPVSSEKGFLNRSSSLIGMLVVFVILGIGGVVIHENSMNQRYESTAAALNRNAEINSNFKKQLSETKDSIQDLKEENRSINKDNKQLKNKLSEKGNTNNDFPDKSSDRSSDSKDTNH